MHFTDREWWGLIHGMGLGALFLLAFAGGLAGLYSLKPTLVTEAPGRLAFVVKELVSTPNPA